MPEEENKKNEQGEKSPEELENAIKNIVPVPSSKDLEKEDPTETQKKIEEEVAKVEETYKSDDLSTELSKNRTHMSEHRTRLSEHRTDLSEHRTGLSEHRTSLSEERTDLSFQRTALSYERTLMSWIRTATSMISFGFTIYKFFEEVQKEGHSHKFLSPRVIGMVMISFGFLSLLFAQIQHNQAYKKIKAEYPTIQRSLSSVLSYLVLAFGLLLFFAAVFRQ